MVHTVQHTTFPSNTYLVAENTQCVVIDPGLDFQPLKEAIDALQLTPIAILSTHGHFDHIASAQELMDIYQIPFYLHTGDQKIVRSANFFIKLVGIKKTIKTPIPTGYFTEEQSTFSPPGFESFAIQRLGGHSSGSCVIQYKDCIFTGDLVYSNGIIENNFPGENIAELHTAIRELFGSYPNSLTAYPGHGKPNTLEKIKTSNPDIQEILQPNG